MKELTPGERVTFILPKTIPKDLLHYLNDRCKLYGNRGIAIYSLLVDHFLQVSYKGQESIQMEKEMVPERKGIDSIPEEEGDTFFDDFGLTDTPDPS